MPFQRSESGHVRLDLGKDTPRHTLEIKFYNFYDICTVGVSYGV